MDMGTSTSSCVRCELKLDLGFIYVGSLDFVRANSDHILRGPEGDHTCCTCGGDFHDNSIGSKIAHAVERGNFLGFMCSGCLNVFLKGVQHTSVLRKIASLIDGTAE